MEFNSENPVERVRWSLLISSIGAWIFFMLVVNIFFTPRLGAEVGLGAVPFFLGIICISAGFFIWISIVVQSATKDSRYRLAYMGALWFVMLNAAWGTWALPLPRPYGCLIMTASPNARDNCYINKAAYLRDGKICDNVSDTNKLSCFRSNGRFVPNDEYVRVKEVAYAALLANPPIWAKGVAYPSLAAYVKDGEDRVVANDLYERVIAGIGRGDVSVSSGGYGMGWSESGKAYTGRKGYWGLGVSMSRDFIVKQVSLDEKLEYGSDFWKNDEAVDQDCEVIKQCPEGYACRTYNGPSFGYEPISRCVVKKDLVVSRCKYFNLGNSKDTQCQKGTACVILGVFESDPDTNSTAMGCVPHKYLKLVN